MYLPSLSGTYDEGLPLLNKALALNPYPASWWKAPFFYKAYREEDYETALARAHDIAVPGWFWSSMFFAMTYAQLGQQDRAATEIESLLSLKPDIATTVYDEFRKFNHQEPAIRKMIEGLRKAGLEVPDKPPLTD